MANDTVDIFNMALSAVGARAAVSSPTEASREAEVCSFWFENVRDQVLHAAPWPSTRAVKRLALLKERDVDAAWVAADPEPGYRFAYSAPSDMLRPRHLSTFERFILGVTSANQHAIMTQVEDAILVYTRRQDSVGMWDAQLTMAISYALAAHIAMPLTGKPERAKVVEERANVLIQDARVAAANSDDADFDTLPDWIRARGYSGDAPSTRYLYPFGSLIVVTEGVGVR